MPTSSPELITDVVKKVIELHPISILDVGIGFGKYGLLFREYLDVMYGRYERWEWNHQIDGVEIFSNYLHDASRMVYNKIIEGNILTFRSDKRYDLIFMGDVIEHMAKDEGIRLLFRLRKDSDILLTTPNGYYVQKAYKGNKAEIHKCGYEPTDFNKLNAMVLKKDYMLMVFIKRKREHGTGRI